MRSEHAEIVEILKTRFSEDVVAEVAKAFEQVDAMAKEKNMLYVVTMPKERFKRYLKFMDNE